MESTEKNADRISNANALSSLKCLVRKDFYLTFTVREKVRLLPISPDRSHRWNSIQISLALSPSNIGKWVLLSMCSFFTRNKKKTERSNTSSNIRKGLCIIDDNKAMANVHIWSVHLRRRTSVWNVSISHEEIWRWSPRPETKDNRRRMSIDWLLFLTLHR